MQVNVCSIGGSAGIVLPEEVLRRLHVWPGEMLCLTETSSGYLLTPCGEEAAGQMDSAREGMSRYRNALRGLAG